MDREDERGLLESVVRFGTGYATGDPWRWSPVTVEMLLADWFPRTVIAEPAYPAKLPDLLRAYVRYCHDRNGIRGDLTAETFAAIDQYEPGLHRRRGRRRRDADEARRRAARGRGVRLERHPRGGPADGAGHPCGVRRRRRRNPRHRAPHRDAALPCQGSGT
jgi:hypothetical protein